MIHIVQSRSTLRLNIHHHKILYNREVDPYLHKFGLHQMVIMGDCQLDKSLTITFVER
jgi:hypothetical protein